MHYFYQSLAQVALKGIVWDLFVGAQLRDPIQSYHQFPIILILPIVHCVKCKMRGIKIRSHLV